MIETSKEGIEWLSIRGIEKIVHKLEYHIDACNCNELDEDGIIEYRGLIELALFYLKAKGKTDHTVLLEDILNDYKGYMIKFLKDEYDTTIV